MQAHREEVNKPFARENGTEIRKRGVAGCSDAKALPTEKRACAGMKIIGNNRGTARVGLAEVAPNGARNQIPDANQLR